eukprot:TRINITY_DN3666_c0_g1_i8.p1 TRINITY_DN3666_c0_g1~~TRINITY_DN3666_c0_g1_i8.p1  ORF type:complete len:566 (-),score=52.04 TRINITY_DN3666_c0_g1_i8:4-1701(-)
MCIRDRSSILNSKKGDQKSSEIREESEYELESESGDASPQPKRFNIDGIKKQNASLGMFKNTTEKFPQVQQFTKKEFQKRREEYKKSRKIFDHFPTYITGKHSAAEVRILKKSLMKSDTFAAVISLFGIILSWLESEIHFQGYGPVNPVSEDPDSPQYYDSTNATKSLRNIVRFFISMSTIQLCFFIYNHYIIELEIMKSNRLLFGKITLWESPLLKRFLLEIFVSFIHTPPGAELKFTINQLGKDTFLTLDTVISVVMLGRLYVCFRLFDHYTMWTDERASRVCQMNGFMTSPTFALKAYLRYRAHIILAIGLIVSILIFGIVIRAFERSFLFSGRRHQYDFIWNSFWCVIVTMTTIGYGDIYPVTHLGRLTTVFACIWGIFILSLVVVTLNDNVKLTSEQSSAYDEIIRVKYAKKRNALEKEAINVLINHYKIMSSQKKNQSMKERIDQRLEFANIAMKFRVKRKNVEEESEGISEILEQMHSTVEESFNFLFGRKKESKKGESLNQQQINEHNKNSIKKVEEAFALSQQMQPDMLKKLDAAENNHLEIIKLLQEEFLSLIHI